MTPTSFQDIKAFTAQSIAARDQANVPSYLRPSVYWSFFINHFRYLWELSDSELRRMRFHTYHLTGDYYVAYTHQPASTFKTLVKEYRDLVAETGGYAGDEGEAGYGHPVDGAKVTIDTVRYMQVIADLAAAKAIDRVKVLTVLEIGGGYGGLARSIMCFNPNVAYVICDLEETQFIQAHYLATCFGFDAVELCPHGLAPGTDLKPGKFYLMPQHTAATIPNVSLDLVINQQSLQEMTEEQIAHYIDYINLAARKFYSCNSQHNDDVVSELGVVARLEGILDERFRSIDWQSRSRQNKHLRRIKKAVKLALGRPVRTVGDAGLRRIVYAVGEGC